MITFNQLCTMLKLELKERKIPVQGNAHIVTLTRSLLDTMDRPSDKSNGEMQELIRAWIADPQRRWNRATESKASAAPTIPSGEGTPSNLTPVPVEPPTEQPTANRSSAKKKATKKKK